MDENQHIFQIGVVAHFVLESRPGLFKCGDDLWGRHNTSRRGNLIFKPDSGNFDDLLGNGNLDGGAELR